jgi:hypothetical protein
MTDTKQKLKLSKIDGDCFQYEGTHLSKIQRVLSFILNRAKYRYSYKKAFITTVFNKLSKLILPTKYKSLQIQRNYGRKLQAVSQSKRVFSNDKLIGGIHVIKTGLTYRGCLLIGKLNQHQSENTKSPYSSAKIAALNQFRKIIRAKFDSAYISNKQNMKKILLAARKKRALWVNQLKKQAKIDFKKKPKDKTPVMRALYARLQKRLQIIETRLKSRKQQFKNVTSTIRQLKAKKVENPTLFKAMTQRKVLKIRIASI